jgi:hypothetical protein
MQCGPGEEAQIDFGSVAPIVSAAGGTGRSALPMIAKFVLFRVARAAGRPIGTGGLHFSRNGVQTPMPRSWPTIPRSKKKFWWKSGEIR